jgi:hypothetical protein
LFGGTRHRGEVAPYQPRLANHTMPAPPPDAAPSTRQPWSRRDLLTISLGLGGITACRAAGDAAQAPSPTSHLMSPRTFRFLGGDAGDWGVTSIRPFRGESLPPVERIAIESGAADTLPAGARWLLRGATSNDRYVTRSEKTSLLQTQAPLGRPEATHGALIPIRKNAAWWALTQDERREVFEETSRHIAIGMKYLPAIARRLHHCRDLGSAEPFDFLTLFDFAAEHATAFEDLVGALRASHEWTFVERELDLRLVRAT